MNIKEISELISRKANNPQEPLCTQDFVRLSHEIMMSRYRDRLYYRSISYIAYEYDKEDKKNPDLNLNSFKYFK